MGGDSPGDTKHEFAGAPPSRVMDRACSSRTVCDPRGVWPLGRLTQHLMSRLFMGIGHGDKADRP